MQLNSLQMELGHRRPGEAEPLELDAGSHLDPIDPPMGLQHLGDIDGFLEPGELFLRGAEGAD